MVPIRFVGRSERIKNGQNLRENAVVRTGRGSIIHLDLNARILIILFRNPNIDPRKRRPDANVATAFFDALLLFGAAAFENEEDDC